MTTAPFIDGTASERNAGCRIEVSVVVPTLNEAHNLHPLAERIASAMAGQEYEFIVVDDGSSDGTPEAAEQLSRTHPLVLLARQEPTGGLAGAVLEGFAMARGRLLAVMDADLQHPPERLPKMLGLLGSG